MWRAAIVAWALGVIGPGAMARAAALPADLEAHLSVLTDGLRVKGLTSERLRAKAREGVAKGVPGSRILEVLDVMQQQMRDMATMVDAVTAPAKLDALSRNKLVENLATSLLAGASPAALQAFATHLREPSRTVAVDSAVNALTVLVVQGYNSRDAERLVQAALEEGLGPMEFAALPGAVRDLAADRGPAEALKAMFERVRAADRPAGIGSSVGGPSGVGGPANVGAPASGQNPKNSGGRRTGAHP